jgi:pyruvate dehydrogenase E2 component (dihydrolipoamide acetyltransferase)
VRAEDTPNPTAGRARCASEVLLVADVVMPRLSDSMEEGTVLQWLKQVGDDVAVGDELVEIETDKANMAYEADVAGTLAEILVQEGETVPIGTPIARVGDSDEGADASAAGPVAGEGEALRAGHGPFPTSAPTTGDASESAETQTTEATAPADDGGHRIKASPLARRIAKERQLDLRQLHGSGPGGRILKADVESASSASGVGEGVSERARRPLPRPTGSAKAASPPGEEPSARSDTPSPAAGPAAEAPGPSPETAKGQVSYEGLSKTQQVIARRMAESKATAPHFYLRATVDMSEAVAGREMVKARALPGDVVPSFNDMVVKACALALREHPRANGAYRDGRFELYSRVNVGVAVAAQDALIVPTLFDADRKGLRQIASEARALAGKVREGQIIPPELSGATFTVSNLGMYGIDGFSAVINPPQAAILAVGAIAERPVVRDGEIATAHLMQVDLACDHRILYGAPAAEFLARVRALLEEPLSLAL